jgi:alkanesulfonate monooxygenase SsuD/methylene tetrahydromethanopterin reductase-like flavin-dependent oxidoreductase (luciferase family)
MLPDVAHPLRLGLKNSGQETSISALRDVWRIADQAGFDHVWDFDHLASIGAGGPDRPVYEGWALQAAMAEATRRVRIGCMVTGNTYRHPALLAKLAVTVDHLCGGRLEFGIGAAWAEIEHEMYGIEGLDHRVGRLPSRSRRPPHCGPRTGQHWTAATTTSRMRSPIPSRSRSRTRPSGSAPAGRR